LIHRFTEGVYYEIINQPDFNNAFGAAFQAYVGEVLAVVNTGGALTILPESEYHVGRDRKDTVDWIVGDDTGELFIECKTKRIQLAAKVALADLSTLESEVDKLAKFVVQIYKTLHDAISGHYTSWTRSDRPIFPLIVMLEEWYVFGPKILEMVDARIKQKFHDNRLDVGLLGQFPYVIGSVGDFERLLSIAASRGIAPVIHAIQSPSRRGWLMHGALRDAFPNEFRLSSRNLFPETLEQITGE
jgi:hypothetical protein